ncbi:MAG TPA: hypothetical protein VGX48_18875 [Pyrinomonadaceae bacterium]|nr:hypothetical protein [Pyrinomonadaceae bacterium]
MSRKTQQTEHLTRYLLGEMPEEERARLEDEFLGDEGLFQGIADAENDLLDDYVGDRLGRRERESFERHYLRLPGSRERLQAARLIARERAARADAGRAGAARVAVTEPERAGFWESLRAFRRGAFPSVMPYALGLAVLALAVGGVWWAVTRGAGDDGGRAPQLAESRSTPAPRATVEATPTPADAPPDAGANAPTPTPPETDTPREAPPRPVQTPAPRRPAERTVTVLALAAGLTRGEGAANRLVVPKGGGTVRLEFSLGEGDYKDVRASLRTVEGREVWGGAVRAPRTGRRAALSLPARLFSDEDYLLILSGVNAEGERVELQEFYFNAQVR